MTVAMPRSRSGRWTGWRNCGCGSRIASSWSLATSPWSSTPIRLGSRRGPPSCPPPPGRPAPSLPAARGPGAPAGRRYLAGWPMSTELHVLNDPHMERRAAGEDSREALRGTAERLYAQMTVAANNTALPPSWTPRRFVRYLRWAWLVEGGAQYFSRQVGLYRAAAIRRLRDSPRPSSPP